MLLRIHHAAIICSDYERSRRFYTEVLGLRVVAEHLREARQSDQHQDRAQQQRREQQEREQRQRDEARRQQQREQQIQRERERERQHQRRDGGSNNDQGEESRGIKWR